MPTKSTRTHKLLTRGVPVIAVLVAGAYVGACALAPLDTPTLKVSMNLEQEVTNDAQIAQDFVNTYSAPTAVSWSDGTTWVNDDTVRPLASISKLVTVLVSLEKQPLAAGEDGPIHVWSQADVAQQDIYRLDDGILYETPVGTEVTTRQMLELSLIMSANDYAYAYAMSVFGSQDAFLAAVDEWKTKHGLDSLTFVEPTGMDAGNAAAPTDIMKIGWLAAQNPTITEITSMSSATMPWSSKPVESTNWLLGDVAGTFGLKTGFIEEVGYNFVVGQHVEVNSRPLTQLTVMLARDSEEERADQATDIAASLQTLPKQVDLLTEGTSVGTMTSVTGESAAVKVGGSAQATLVPGETATVTVDWQKPKDGAKGTVGTATVTSPEGTTEVPIELTKTLEGPDLWWRLTHPGAVTGAFFG